MAWDPRNNNPYGVPLLRRAYRWYYLLEYVVRNWGRTIERFGMPNVYGIVHDSKKGEARNKLLGYLNELRTRMVGVFSKGTEIQVLDSKISESVRTFSDAAQTSTRGIFRAALLPAMVMEKDGTGSLALTRNQADTQFSWPVKYIAEKGRDTLQTQLVHRDHLLNYGPGVPEPRFAFNDFVRDDMTLKLQVFEAAFKWGFPITAREVAENFDLDPADFEASDILAPRAASAATDDMEIELGPHNERVAATATHMLFDAARGNLKALQAWYNPAADTPGHVLGQVKHPKNPNQKGLAAIDDSADLAGALRDEEASIEHWGEIGGIAMGEIAQEVEARARAGKSDGARPVE
jgi:phage gp29-like protein